MTIFRRATDLLSANLHEWIERCEDPERMLKQLVRELGEAADLTMDATAKAIANERLLERQLVAQRHQRERLQERARAAVARGDETAARTATAARLRQQPFLDACESQYLAAMGESSRLRQHLEVVRSRLSEARQTMHVYATRQRIAESRRTVAGCSPGRVSGNEVWGRFGRLCERIDRADAESAALLELLEATEAEEGRPFDVQVEEELELLKAEIAGAASVDNPDQG